MKTSTRFTILSVCVLVCASGIMVAKSSHQTFGENVPYGRLFKRFDARGYRYAADEPRESDLKQIESAILLHNAVKSGYESFEFGTVKIDGGFALVSVFYFSRDARVLPLLYKLTSEKQSWKIVSVQRMGFATRLHLLRDLRV
jgi:hypothetical protein